MQKIAPFLWFNNNAEEAMNFYLSVFKNTKAGKINRVNSGTTQGTISSCTFEIEGQEFMALNGGPTFTFNPAISFFINCETQDEVDHLWENLSEGGEKMQCGWVKDKFGVCWQIVPTILGKLLYESDPAKSAKVVQAMLKMHQLNIQELKDAYDNA